jgi:hypothetical protein
MLSVDALVFDPDNLLAGLKTQVECESPKSDAATAVSRMMDPAPQRLVLLGAQRGSRALEERNPCCLSFATSRK